METGKSSVLREFYGNCIPNVLTQLVVASPPFLGILFIGHFQHDNIASQTAIIAGAGLGYSVINVACISVGTGFCNVFDTCVSQAFGAGDLEACTWCLWRVRAILCVLYVLMLPALYFGEDVLLLLGQERLVSAYAGKYLRTSLFGIWLFLYSSANRKFLRNLGKPVLVLHVVVLTALFHGAWLWLFVNQLGLGVQGLALANMTTWGLTSIGLEATLWIQAPAIGIQRTWLLPNMHVLREWGDLVKIGTASAVQLCGAWWIWQVFIIMAGYLGPVQLAANAEFTACIEWVCNIYLGASATTAQLVGREVGAGRTEEGKRIGFIGVFASLPFWVLPAIALLFAPVANVFTSDPAVQETLSSIFRIYALGGFMDTAQNVLGGVMRGIGRPVAASFTYLALYYLLALPLALVFAFQFDWDLGGIWWATIVGNSAAVVVFSFIILRQVESRSDMKPEGDVDAGSSPKVSACEC